MFKMLPVLMNIIRLSLRWCFEREKSGGKTLWKINCAGTDEAACPQCGCLEMQM